MPDPAGDAPMASPIIISQSETHIVVAIELSRSDLARHARFLKLILDYAVTTGPPRHDWE
jgi:hypothetical protein